MSATLPPAWREFVGTAAAEHTDRVLERVAAERAERVVYPDRNDVFAALEMTSPEQVRVVIVGQDPYHGPHQAHGLAFSVMRGTPLPPSLRNIFRELQSSGAVETAPLFGDLTPWARQGVLLLNTALTVREAEAASHAELGWSVLIDAIISRLDAQATPIIFALWGAHAQRVGARVDRSRHHVLEAPHPSPLSAHRGFFGCGHFVTINRLLAERGEPPIDWTT